MHGLYNLKDPRRIFKAIKILVLKGVNFMSSLVSVRIIFNVDITAFNVLGSDILPSEYRTKKYYNSRS
jgi:hypothetical protein